jgi:hypothetical protein
VERKKEAKKVLLVCFCFAFVLLLFDGSLAEMVPRILGVV